MDSQHIVSKFPVIYHAGINHFLSVEGATRNDIHAWNLPFNKAFEIKSKASAKLQEAEQAMIYMASHKTDRRLVGLDAEGNIITISQLWSDALRALAYQAKITNPNWLKVAAKIEEAIDATSCADKLGLQEVSSCKEAEAELERVGLGWIQDDADLSPAQGPLWRLRIRG